jgi:phospholipid transport system transporter-binding protein
LSRHAPGPADADEVTFSDLGGGRFAVSGALGFTTAMEALDTSKRLFEDYSIIELDLAGLVRADSAGLALLLEWVNWARHTAREIRFLNIPAQITSIAEISEVEDMLHMGERWTGAQLEPTPA